MCKKAAIKIPHCYCLIPKQSIPYRTFSFPFFVSPNLFSKYSCSIGQLNESDSTTNQTTPYLYFSCVYTNTVSHFIKIILRHTS